MKRRLKVNIPLGPDKKDPTRVLKEGRVYDYPSPTWDSLCDQMRKTLDQISSPVPEDEVAHDQMQAELIERVEALEAQVADLQKQLADQDAPPSGKKRGGKG